MYICIADAQRVSSLISKTFYVESDTVKLDSLSIIPGTVIVEDKENQKIIDYNSYIINEVLSLLIWLKKPVTDSVLVTFKVFPYELGKRYFHKDESKVGDDISKLFDPFVYNPLDDDQQNINFGGLNYSGSFSRGISFGNSQDLVPSSDLNLQISGMLHDVEIMAAITDQNMPLQPEGNTQQLQEFDKIYIQLKRKRSKLTMGDYELKRPDSYFMHFYKKTQGAEFDNYIKLKNKGGFKNRASIAFSKGTYYKYNFVGEESNQGPYKLKGKNGEIFIIIIAGTERVYIDGEQLQRGADKDYVIDYNTGEITFTSNRLITKDKRISVEYEYSNQNYNRIVTFLGTQYGNDKLKVKLNLYAEQDNKYKPVQDYGEDRTKLIRETLKKIGDNTAQAFISGVGTTNYDSSRIMYQMIDTIIIDTLTMDTVFYDSVFVYSTNPDSAIFVLSFTFVGQGYGDYIIAQNNANGRVYQWVAPENNVKQGRYAPVILLVAPKKKQLYTMGVDYNFSEDDLLKTEIAVSNSDLNTFSEKDNHDNIGFAGKIGLKNKIWLNKKNKKDAAIKTGVEYEALNINFSPIERYRPVEFMRDWNLNEISSLAEENLGSAMIGFMKKEFIDINYKITSYIRNEGDSIDPQLGPKNDYRGLKQDMDGIIEKNGFRVTCNGSYLESKSLLETTFFRPKVEISKGFAKLNGWRIGVGGEREENRIYNTGFRDTLTSGSFKFDMVNLYLKNADTAINEIGLNVSRRYDYVSTGNHFDTSTIANTYAIGSKLVKNPRNQLNWSVTYRELIVVDSTKTNQKGEESVLGRIEYTVVVKKGLFRSSTFYEIGTGQEQKLDYTFVQVAIGEGQYIYLGDLNNNGIAEQNEYEIAVFADEGNYVKVYAPTNDYVKANAVQFNQHLNITPKAIWHDKKGFRKLISKFSTQSSLQINRKSYDDASGFPFNPFMLEEGEISLITLHTNIRNSLYFNRGGSKFGAEINWQSGKRQSLLVNGFERMLKDEQGVKIRWNISKHFTTDINAKTGNKINTTEFFSIKDYHIVYNEIAPRLTFLTGNGFRTSLFYSFRESENKSGRELAFNNEVGAEIKYNLLARSTLLVNASYIAVAFGPGKTNTSIGYAMLDGLQRGDNILWNLTYERKIGLNLQMSLSYEGRKTGDANTVHIGRAQVRALF